MVFSEYLRCNIVIGTSEKHESVTTIPNTTCCQHIFCDLCASDLASCLAGISYFNNLLGSALHNAEVYARINFWLRAAYIRGKFSYIMDGIFVFVAWSLMRIRCALS
jgi:hypothetical protein